MRKSLTSLFIIILFTLLGVYTTYISTPVCGETPKYSLYEFIKADFNGDLSISTPYGVESFSSSGTVSYTSGVSNRAANLTGTIISKDWSDLAGPLYLSFYFKIEKQKSSLMKIAEIHFSDSSVKVMIYRDNETKKAVFNILSVYYSSSVIIGDSWVHCKVVLEPLSSKVLIYINNNIAASSSLLEFPDPGLKVFFGSMGDNVLLIDEFKVTLSPVVEVVGYIIPRGAPIELRGKQFLPYRTLDISIINEANELKVCSFKVDCNGRGLFTYTIPSSDNFTYGLYRIEVISDDLDLHTYFGVWGPESDVVEKTAEVTVRGGGLNRESRITYEIRSSEGSILLRSFTVSNSRGDFLFTFSIPAKYPSGIYTIKISTTSGTIASPKERIESSYSINVVNASLRLYIEGPKEVYTRGDNLSLLTIVKYPNGSICLSQPKIDFIILPDGRIDTRNEALKPSGIGRWHYSYPFDMTSPLGEYRFHLSVEDDYGNKGIYELSVRLIALTLNINVKGIKESYLLTETVNLELNLTYPSSEQVSAANLSLLFICRGILVQKVDWLYRYSERDYSFLLTPDMPTGPWELQINGSDQFGNLLIYNTSFSVRSVNISLSTSTLCEEYVRGDIFEVTIYPSYVTGYPIDVSNLYVSAVLTIGDEDHLLRSSIHDGGILLSLDIPKDSPEGEATLRIHISDPYGNSGGVLLKFWITSSTLSIELNVSKTHLQLGFDSINVTVQAVYPDGSPLTPDDGEVILNIISGGSIISSHLMAYNGRVWTILYSPDLTSPSGVYILNVTATDLWGNSGYSSVRITVSQFLLFLSVGIIFSSIAILIVAFVKHRGG